MWIELFSMTRIFLHIFSSTGPTALFIHYYIIAQLQIDYKFWFGRQMAANGGLQLALNCAILFSRVTAAMLVAQVKVVETSQQLRARQIP